MVNRELCALSLNNSLVDWVSLDELDPVWSYHYDRVALYTPYQPKTGEVVVGRGTEACHTSTALHNDWTRRRPAPVHRRSIRKRVFDLTTYSDEGRRAIAVRCHCKVMGRDRTQQSFSPRASSFKETLCPQLGTSPSASQT